MPYLIDYLPQLLVVNQYKLYTIIIWCVLMTEEKPMEAGTSDTVFSRAAQEEFWGALTPDLRRMLSYFESKESWTYQVEEYPSLYTNLARELPRIASLPLTDDARSLIDHLIPLLTSTPLRHAIFAISWLDYHSPDDLPVGWGVLTYLRCEEIVEALRDGLPVDEVCAQTAATEQVVLCANIFYQRINVLLQTRLEASLFSRLSDHLRERSV